MRRHAPWLAAALLFGSCTLPSHDARVVTVGVDNSPPFYIFQPNGSVRGLAVEILTEAARRCHIRIHWVPLADTPINEALAARRVQMWPLAAASPERRKRFFLSEPWLDNDFALVSPREKPVRTPQEAAGLKIVHGRFQTTQMVAAQHLPGSQLLVTPDRVSAVEEMCKGNAAAALLESRVLDSMLLDRPASCGNLAWNISIVPGARVPLSLIAVPEMAPLARELRTEISRMAADGELGTMMDPWAPYSAEVQRANAAERAAGLQTRYLTILAAAFLITALLLAWIANRAARLGRAAATAGEEARQLQDRFAAFMDHIPAAAYIKDTDGRMVFMNRSLCNTWNVHAGEWIGKSDVELWPPDIAQALRQNDLAMLRSGKSREFLEQAPLSNGETRHFLTIKFPFQADSGKVMVGGVSLDITDRQAAESALRISETFNRSILENTVDLIETLDCEGHLVSSNFRLPVPRLIGEPWAPAWDESRAAEVQLALDAALDGRPAEFQAPLKANPSLWFSVLVSPILDPETGAVRSLLAVARDITVTKKSEQQLRESQKRSRELFEFNPLPSLLYDVSTLKIVDVNDAAIQRYGYSRQEFLSITLPDIHPPEDVSVLRGYLKDLPVPKTSKRSWRHRAKNGRVFPIEVTGHNLTSYGSGIRMIIVQDITERERAAAQLRNSEFLYRSVVEHAGDIIYQTDAQGRFSFSNDGALRVLALRRGEIIGKPFTELIHPLDRSAVFRFYARQRCKRIPETYFEFRCIGGDGQLHWLGQNVQILVDDEGRITGFQAIARDITERRKVEDSLARQAREDALTGLPNRRTVMAQLNAMLRNPDPLCLCIADIDSFKAVNDNFGHNSGDEVLKVLATILRQGLRRQDIAARLGGDEFCIVLPNTSIAEAMQTIERMRGQFATVAFSSNDRVFSVTASFGIAEWTPGITLAHLFEAADEALYRGKRQGKNLSSVAVAG